jgi:hypothetical protein
MQVILYALVLYWQGPSLLLYQVYWLQRPCADAEHSLLLEALMCQRRNMFS